jgi:hypothetical protein
VSPPIHREIEVDFMDNRRLEVEIYQIGDDMTFKKNRTDGTGWEWCWADWQRDWMDATPSRFAYRCLPLTIVNQTGWWIKNPVGFTATWRGRREPGDIQFRFDTAGEFWKRWINDQFGEGIITWNTPFLFRTQPEGSRLLVCGPVNYFKANLHPLTALIESDWISMSFTMNWKIMAPNQPVRFEVGEPLFQAIPIASNVCSDMEEASVSYQRLSDNPELLRVYQEWDTGRRKFHEQKLTGEVKPTDWQKDYFQGRDAIGREAATIHMTKVKPPSVRFRDPTTAGTYQTSSVAAGRDSAGSANGGDDDDRVSRARAASAAARRSSAKQASAMTAAGVAANPSGAGSDPVGLTGGVGPDDLVAAVQPSTSVVYQSEEPEEDSLQFQVYVDTATMELDDDGEAEFDTPAPQHGVATAGLASQAGAQDAAAPAGSAGGRRVDDQWRSWIAENLMVGQPPESILEAMESSGFAREESIHEISLAAESPYFKGSQLLRNRLKKRDWLQSVYRKLNRMHPASAEMERRHKLTRDQFLREYYTTNRPVIITGMMEEWPAMRKWNLDYFAERFADREVEVQMNRTAGADYEVDHKKYTRKIRFGAFIEKLRTAGETNDFYLTANNSSSNRQALPELWDDIVQIPEYLSSTDPGGFLWMGPAGTVTPFHHDLTNNFMAQVIGRKRLKIAPSWDMPLMLNYLHCFSRVDGRVSPSAPRPHQLAEPQILEFLLNPGEILFLPIGCLHFVQGVDISVTVSFTNFVFDNDFSSFYTTYGPV